MNVTSWNHEYVPMFSFYCIRNPRYHCGRYDNLIILRVWEKCKAKIQIRALGPSHWAAHNHDEA